MLKILYLQIFHRFTLVMADDRHDHFFTVLVIACNFLKTMHSYIIFSFLDAALFYLHAHI
jgi:hypothetical protein